MKEDIMCINQSANKVITQRQTSSAKRESSESAK